MSDLSTPARPLTPRVTLPSLIKLMLKSALSLSVTLGGLTSTGAYAQELDRTEEAFLKVFPKPSDELLEAGAALYTARCAHCHGERNSRSKGVLNKNLRPQPRNLKSKAWFERVSYKKRLKQLKTVILSGGPALGLSPLMPPNSDLSDQPELLYALIYQIASLHKPRPVELKQEAPSDPKSTQDPRSSKASGGIYGEAWAPPSDEEEDSEVREPSGEQGEAQPPKKTRQRRHQRRRGRGHKRGQGQHGQDRRGEGRRGARGGPPETL